MASSGWKGQRGSSSARNVKGEKSQLHPIGSQGRERGAGGGGHEVGGARNDFVPQRPPTVGQELPNNLDWQIDGSTRVRSGTRNSSKKGNLDKNREKKVEVVGSAATGGRTLDESLLTFGTSGWTSSQPLQFPPPSFLVDHTKKKKPLPLRMVTLSDDGESRSERDDDESSHQASNHGARPKKNSSRNGGAVCSHPNLQMQCEQVTQGRIAEDDIAKTMSTNQVVAKLFQIRDYIKQVTTTIAALQNSCDPATLTKMEKLHQIRTELIEHERRLVDLFQRVVMLQGDPLQMDNLNSDFASLASINANVDGRSEESTCEIEDAVAAEEAESIARSNELLKQVAESQEKIKALQEQKSAMLNLQHQAENRLAQAKAFHGNLIVKTGNGEVRPLTAEEFGVSQALQDDLENIEQRLSMLQTLYSNKDWSESSSRSVDGEVCRVMDKSIAEAQRRELQDKLLHLQHKKQQMDDLLNELCILRERRWQGDQPTSENADVKEDVDDKQHLLKHTAITKETIAASAQQASVDTTDKIRKLDEMKSWLHTLQDMVYSHQPGKSMPNVQSVSNHSGDREAENAAVDLLISPSENLRSKLKKPKKPKTDNISRQQSNECITNLSANYVQQPYREQPGRVDEASDDGNESDFQEKVWRLHEAKSKLEKLQGLLNAVQQVQQTNQTGFVEEMFNTIDNDHLAVNTVPINESLSATSPSCREQSKLKRLPAVQSNTELKGRVKEQSPASVASRTSVSGQVRHQIQEDRIEQRPRQKSNVSSCDSSVEVSKLQTSNHDLMLEMRHQIALREELRQRHRELENLMQKDAGKNYLLNQDNHSENMSASAKSEFYMLNASTVATDVTTAATWGGSSVDNGVRDTMDCNDSQEEPNERCGEDEEYSSDEGVEVDNSILTTTSRLDAPSPKPRKLIIDPDSASIWVLPEPRRTSTDFIGGELHSGRIQNNASSSNMTRSGQQQQQQTHSRLKSVPVTLISSDRNDHQGERIGVNSDNQQPPPPGFFPFQPGSSHLRQQLDAANLFYQTLLGDQQRVAGLSETYPVPPSNLLPMLPAMNVADVFQAQHSQMVQQQLLLGLSHCYHVLYLQQLEMQQLQQTLQNSASTNTSCASEPRSSQLHGPNVGETRENADQVNVGGSSSSRWHPDNPSMARMTLSSSSPHVAASPPFQLLNQSTLTHPTEPPHSFLHPDMHPTPTSNTETLNNQVPPGNRANNYWDNFRSYSRQNLLSSVSHPNKSNDCFRGQCMTFPRASAPSARNMPSLGQESNDRQRASVSLEVPPFVESAAVSNDYLSHHGTGENNRLVNPGHRSSQDLPKHKINKELSGLAVGQNVLKNCGNMSPNNGSVSTNQPLSTQSSISGISAKVPLKLEWNNANAGEKESEQSAAPKHTVEDAVYSEIVSLVSHFNSDAQHLVQLLREMHKLNDGNAINRALRALRDVSASDVPQSDVVIGHGGAQNQASNAIPSVSRSRPVYTDSSSSTDGNERSHYVKARRSTSRYPVGRRSSYDLSQTYVDSRVKHSQSPDGFPSASAVFISPEHGRMVTANELKLGGVSPHQPSAPGFILQGIASPNSLRQENSASEAASSSAHERESETSTDAPCSRFNIQQLDKQMQGIMMSLSSFVASFNRLNCNSKLVSAISSHVMALVLPLIHNLNQDTQNFPPGQFACILDNILSKYIGRRFAECEESLLSELSEVLFNELAFVQLMQNMDGNGVQLRSQKFHSLVEKFSTQTRNGVQSTNSNLGLNGTEEPVVVRNVSPAPFQCANVKSGASRAEATDADLVVMSRRGDEEIGDKMHDDFSCDIPDVCAGRVTISSASADVDVSALRASLAHLDSHPILSPTPLPEHGMLATAAEGQGEIRNYFDREVEIEEGIGDTQDLAEADQSQNYMEAVSALDDVQEEEGFQVWCANGDLLNGGGIDRTEDDQQNEDEMLGAVGFSNGDLGDAEKPGPEVGLDEVPIKLRDGSNSGGVRRDCLKEDSSQDQLSENNDNSKSKKFGNPDNFGTKP